MAYTRGQLDQFRGKSLPDFVAPGVRLLLVGINPGLRSVAVQADFGRRGNRFYPALYQAGITDRIVDASEGFRPDDAAHLHAQGVGMTTLVAFATARADELSTTQLREGAVALREKVRRLRPRVVAMLGITAFRTAFEQRRAVVGQQPGDLAGAELWVVPNPSGLNAHESVASLAVAYREVARAAGIPLFIPPIPRVDHHGQGEA
ncbi:mismatch-specific DNA-glycosylase [Rathayibacter soli]|uniref:mismatch-specific DNA-glycosylase n=1 Tax=Rathayibacter soli TaxID=3144168 RepID=UPI0027E54D52|nr:mismatch-specific DNA-glycosylase [Glaciibacter superstes]